MNMFLNGSDSSFKFHFPVTFEKASAKYKCNPYWLDYPVVLSAP
jgi:hypothetical protein